MTSFTYRVARSGALLCGLGFAIGAETLVLHLWLAPKHPAIAWPLTIGALGTFAWLIADYHALGHGTLRLTAETLEVAIGQRGKAVVPLASVLTAVRSTWREVPASGTLAAAEYMNLLKPASPNVLLTLTVPVSVRLVGGVRRRVRQFGFCLDDPDAFITALSEVRANETVPS
ncbi:MAG: hypothetical protein ABJE47_07340 [bacterium]